jgi:16S rRNA (guanine(1405)-N(7))-methyltransferase
MTFNPDQLDRLVDAVLASPKYKYVQRELVSHIGIQELEKRAGLKQAIKATKKKLHQIGGAYWPHEVNYERWLGQLEEAARPGNDPELLQCCRTIMSHHASTAERLPILAQFYERIFAELPPVQSLLDLACGLNPLAIPWMALPADFEYYAYDIYQDMIDFINRFMAIIKVKGEAALFDLSQGGPTRPADVAFLLKALPCLEQLDKAVSSRLLHDLEAGHIIVSFPAYSLGGKQKGMPAHYEKWFRDITRDQVWSIKRLEFATELVFIVTK